MTNETILTLLNQIDLKKGTNDCLSVEALEELKEGVKQNIMNATNKINRKDKEARLVKAILNNAKKVNQTYQYAWINDEKKMCCTDSHRLLILNNPIEAPVNPDPKFNPNLSSLINRTVDDIEISLPDIKELESNIKIKKAEKIYREDKVCTAIGNKNEKVYTYVNAEYLLEIMKGFGENYKAYINTKEKYPIVYFKGEIGEAILLPLVKTDFRQIGELWIASR